VVAVLWPGHRHQERVAVDQVQGEAGVDQQVGKHEPASLHDTHGQLGQRKQGGAGYAQGQAQDHRPAVAPTMPEHSGGQSEEGVAHRASSVEQADELGPVPQAKQVEIAQHGEDAAPVGKPDQRRGQQVEAPIAAELG